MVGKGAKPTDAEVADIGLDVSGEEVPDVFLCLECKKKVQDNQKSVQCTLCTRWIHQACGVDDTMYKLILELHKKKRKHAWACEGCDMGITNLHGLVEANRRDIFSMKKDITNLKVTARVTTSNSAKLDTLSSDIEVLMGRPDPSASLLTTNKLITDLAREVETLKQAPAAAAAVTADPQEDRRRINKKFNIMVFKYPEQTARDGRERKEGDEEFSMNLLKKLGYEYSIDTVEVGGSPGEISKVLRCGKYEADKVRPLQICLKKSEYRDDIIKASWKLAKDSKFGNVSVAPDLTENQQKEEKALLKEAKELNSKRTPEEAKNYVFKLVGPGRELRKQRLPPAVRQKNLEDEVSLRHHQSSSQEQQKQQSNGQEHPRTRLSSNKRTAAEMEVEEVSQEQELELGERNKQRKQC